MQLLNRNAYQIAEAVIPAGILTTSGVLMCILYISCRDRNTCMYNVHVKFV